MGLERRRGQTCHGRGGAGYVKSHQDRDCIDEAESAGETEKDEWSVCKLGVN